MPHQLRSTKLALTLLIVGLSLGADWPTYMQDNARSGRSRDTLPSPLSQHWVRSSATPPQWAWPGPGDKVIEGLAPRHRVRFDDVFHVAVVNDSVYFGSSVDNTVYCVAVDTGRDRWRFVTSGPIRLAPTVADGRVFVGSDDGHVYCLDARNGAPIWQLRAGPRDERILARGRMTSRWPVRTSVLVDRGLAYFGAGIFPHETVYLYAVNAETGEVIWRNDEISQRDAGRDDLSPQGYLLATDRYLFVPSGRTLPAAFDRVSGELMHKQKGGGKQVGGVEAQLVDDVILSVGEHYILALDQQAGTIKNRLSAHRITLDDDVAYIADGTQITAIDRNQFAQVDEQRLQLEGELAEIQRQLLRHLAPTYLVRVREAQATLENAKGAIANGNPEKPDAATEELKIAKLQEALATAVAIYEGSRQEYETLTKQVGELRERLESLTQNAVKWRAESTYDSAMIQAGSVLVIGGPSRVALFDTATGRHIETLVVDGEARGLAVAEGRLYVSTTAGKVYCFAQSTSESTPVAEAEPPGVADPFPTDEYSELYALAADEIIKRSQVTRGYCLVIGSRQGRLAYELAKRTALKIYCVEPNPQMVDQSRAALASTGLYGHRIAVDHIDLAELSVSEFLRQSDRIRYTPVDRFRSWRSSASRTPSEARRRHRVFGGP